MSTPEVDWFAIVSTIRAVVGGFHSIPIPVREELVQEAVCRTLQADDARSPAGFGRRVARNLAVDWLRRRREEPLDAVGCEDEDGERDQHPAPFRPPGQRVDAERAVALLADAPPSYRETLWHLYLVQGEVDELVAAELGPRSAVADEAWRRARDLVYKRRARGLRWLRRELQRSA